jgi:hypothetical protein
VIRWARKKRQKHDNSKCSEGAGRFLKLPEIVYTMIRPEISAREGSIKES